MSSENPLSDNVKTSEAATSQNGTEPHVVMTATDVSGETSEPDSPAAPPPGSEESAAESPGAVDESAPADVAADNNGATAAMVEEPAPVETTSVSTDEHPTAPPGESSAAPAEGRLRLNPKVDKSMVKAVPSVSAGAAAPQTEESVPAAAAPEEPAAETKSEPEPPRRAAPPVELPSRDLDLDADLEAEIEAAIKADESVAIAAIEAQQSADDEEAPDDEFAPGKKLKGKVQSVHGDNVFFDIGGRFSGVVSARQFLTDKPPAVGDEFDLVVDRMDEAEGLVVLNLPRGRRSIGGNWDAVAKGQVVDCMITKTNKGGLEVTVSNLRGFMPASQVDINYVGDLETFVGQKLQAVITEANPKKRNLIVSRRAFLDIARKEAAEELWKSLAEGQEFSGTVKTLKDYGAFIDIGGVDGFLHVGEISWTRLNHPSDVLSEGQDVKVQVIKLDRDKKRISLGMKQLRADPWTLATANYPVGSTASGRVTRTMDFGAFVELEPGVEGLVHISELDYTRVNKVTDMLNVDQHVELKVLEVDPNRRRIGLSLKQLKEKPPELQKPSPGETAAVDNADDDTPPPPERKRKDPLKGGTGPETPGRGLFGNPNDFS